MIRIAIAEEHTIVRWALREAFAKIPDMLVVGEAGTVEETLEMLRGAKPDVLLLDIMTLADGRLGADPRAQIRAHRSVPAPHRNSAAATTCGARSTFSSGPRSRA